MQWRRNTRWHAIHIQCVYYFSRAAVHKDTQTEEGRRKEKKIRETENTRADFTWKWKPALCPGFLPVTSTQCNLSLKQLCCAVGYRGVWNSLFPPPPKISTFCFVSQPSSCTADLHQCICSMAYVCLLLNIQTRRDFRNCLKLKALSTWAQQLASITPLYLLCFMPETTSPSSLIPSSCSLKTWMYISLLPVLRRDLQALIIIIT